MATAMEVRERLWSAGGPVEELRVLLEAARDPGVGFGEAWSRAVGVVLRGDGVEAWTVALRETRAVWESAYNRAPASAGDLALALLAEDREVRGVEPLGCCVRCGAPEPVERGDRAVYCGSGCRRAAGHQRQKVGA